MNSTNSGGGGAAAGLGDFFSGVKAGALRLLNFATYNVMKDRAGKMGRDTVNPLLQRIQAAVPQGLKFHLVGHSFGGRLVTATVDGPNALRVQTLLLGSVGVESRQSGAVRGRSTDYDLTAEGVLNIRELVG